MENKTTKILLACNIVLFLGLIGIYIIHFCGNNGSNKVNTEATAPLQKEGGLTIAYVDSDSLLAHYQYAIDLTEELQKYKDQQERYYQQQVTSFQKDYQDYLKNGSTLTLSQQQAKEEELKKRQEKILSLEQELMAKITERQVEGNTKMLNAIFAFIREYNAANQKFDIVMRKTFEGSPTLYLNPAMDITNEIIEGLNEEYAQVKGKK